MGYYDVTLLIFGAPKLRQVLIKVDRKLGDDVLVLFKMSKSRQVPLSHFILTSAALAKEAFKACEWGQFGDPATESSSLRSRGLT